MIYLILAIMFIVYLEWEQDRKSKAFWKEWEDNSFEWNGFRFSKDFYEIIDGKIKEK